MNSTNAQTQSCKDYNAMTKSAIRTVLTKWPAGDMRHTFTFFIAPLILPRHRADKLRQILDRFERSVRQD